MALSGVDRAGVPRSEFEQGQLSIEVVGVSRARVSEPARDGELPVHLMASGQCVYWMRQLEVVADAGNVRFHQRAIVPTQPPDTYLRSSRRVL